MPLVKQNRTHFHWFAWVYHSNKKRLLFISTFGDLRKSLSDKEASETYLDRCKISAGYCGQSRYLSM